MGDIKWDNESRAEWDRGYEAGKAMALSLDRPVMTEDFPKEFGHRSGLWSNGYAEGVIAHGMYNGSRPKSGTRNQ